MSVCCLLFLRLHAWKVFSLCVYREGDWLRLEGVRARYDCINTLVIMDNVDAALPYASDLFTRPFYISTLYAATYVEL